MALKFKDGFDYLTAANVTLKWDTSTSGGASLITGAYGKGKAMLNFGGVKTMPGNIVEGYQGFHLFYNSAIAAVICSYLDAGTVQVDFRTDATGALFATRNGTTIGTVSSTHLVPGTVYWIQTRAKIDNTAGIAELSVNGTIVVNSGVTNLDTQGTNAFYNQIRVNNMSSAHWIDSYHTWDTAGGDNFSGYIAETIIDTKLAASAGSNAAWTPNAGTNFSRVNEANHDGDTTYNSSLTPNQIDSFLFGVLDEASGTILDVAVNSIDRDDDATPRTFDHYVKSSSATALSVAITPASNYVNHQSFNPTDPNTSASWTVAGRNAAEFGYKEIS